MVILSGCTNKGTNEPLSKDGFMLGTFVKIKLYDSKNEEILDKAFERLREIENRMSLNIVDSDLSKINNSAGIKPVEVHEDVYYVIKKAKEFAEISSGAFDPTIEPIVKLWGIGTANERVPSEEEINNKLKKIDYNKVQLLEGNRVFLEESGMGLDLGGIAKGYGADEVQKILIENGVKSAIIDLGGNVFGLGSRLSGEPWKIAIQNPFSDNRGSHIGTLAIHDMSVVTSGDYERYFEEEGVKYHHIIDSKTGYPANNNVSGITVLSRYSIDGDALSTAFYVLGVSDGLALAEEIEGIEVVYITKDKKLYLSSGIINVFENTNEEFEISIP